jgi:hypothetical protein
MARYDDEGNCAKVTSISCETRWELRDCFKVALCDFLSCVADEMCTDGKFVDWPDASQMKDCFGNALCTLLQCLPNAICGPKQDMECLPPPALECNYAVEERE